VGDAEHRLEVMSRLEAATGQVTLPGWTQPKRKKSGWHGVAHTLLSDLHLDEVVDPTEVRGCNRYNRSIAEQRIRRLRDKLWMLKNDVFDIYTFDGAVVSLGGDLVSGSIHQELAETNESTTIETCIHWAGILAELLVAHADLFGRVHVVVVVGNHGRYRPGKPRHKLRTVDNFDYLMSHMVRIACDTDTRITWSIPESADARFDILGHRILLTHGDQARGGHGIGGIFPPIMRMRAKKQAQLAAVSDGFDLLELGHFHTPILGQGVLVNNTLKGQDEYGLLNGYETSHPAQFFGVFTKDHGLTFPTWLMVADPKKEGWA